MDSDKLLGEFLHARRMATSPRQAGLAHSGPRRTPGLRREEVAVLAGVSLDYYARLEQGRERRPSDQVLNALARVFQMDGDTTDYLYRLAYPGLRSPAPVDVPERVSPTLYGILAGWNDVPAFVLGRRLDVLASNPMADALYGGLTHRDNCLRMIFLSPGAEDFYADWERAAFIKTAQLRRATATDPDDPALARLVAELRAHSEVFRTMWERHDVGTRMAEDKSFRHPKVGEISLALHRLTVTSGSGQQLCIMAAPPGSLSEQALARLAATLPDGGSGASGSRWNVPGQARAAEPGF
ncbi:helix-turn-helix transcriptional regulator [Microbispora sp. ATCC PTA-5024]|uniref:helix-turn-helix transcriptional regulator n=1 Tax=Microbispora sp. ATCC PTA-5024 TaxID=316330 RepID=UPI00041E20E0|nr:helix-turn-helix transcriptional regulator [Microbispora sp. ATCC PTA-5024]